MLQLPADKKAKYEALVAKKKALERAANRVARPHSMTVRSSHNTTSGYYTCGGCGESKNDQFTLCLCDAQKQVTELNGMMSLQRRRESATNECVGVLGV
jgi:hypothetical protein